MKEGFLEWVGLVRLVIDVDRTADRVNMQQVSSALFGLYKYAIICLTSVNVPKFRYLSRLFSGNVPAGRGVIMGIRYFAALFVFLTVGVTVVTASPTKRFDPATQTCRQLTQENLWDGYVAFRSVCKECHTRDNGQNAPFLYTESKGMKAWNRVFEQQYPECARSGAWKNLDANKLQVLNDYLYRNAAGTYNPNDANDCG